MRMLGLKKKIPLQPMNKPKKRFTEEDFITTGFGDLKEFMSHGYNASVIDMKTRNIADIEMQEERAGKKETKDLFKIILPIIVLLIVAPVAWSMLGSFTDSTECHKGLALCEGSLESCTINLEEERNPPYRVNDPKLKLTTPEPEVKEGDESGNN